MKKLNTISFILAILLIISGFGLIHNGDPKIELIGSVLIGIGSLYLIIRIFLSYSNSKD